MCFPSYVLPFSFFISLVRSAIFDGFLFLLVLPFSLVSPALLSDANPLSLALLPLLLIPPLHLTLDIAYVLFLL